MASGPIPHHLGGPRDLCLAVALCLGCSKELKSAFVQKLYFVQSISFLWYLGRQGRAVGMPFVGIWQSISPVSTLSYRKGPGSAERDTGAVRGDSRVCAHDGLAANRVWCVHSEGAALCGL